MMKLNDFINRLELALKEPSKYQSGGWGKWDGKYWNWDCICLIKGILWGWKNDKTKPRGGGAIYGSNGVPDKGTDEMINLCKDVSTDFSNLVPGEMVWMPGHVGVVYKKDVIIEATVAFGGGCVKSKINSKGQRLYYSTGKNAGPNWQKHGKLPWVDYNSVDPKPEPTPTPIPSKDLEYVVVKGDTLSKIANNYGTTYQKLAEYNNIPNPDLIHVGQKIKIPNGGSTQEYKYHIVQKGETLWGIAKKYYGNGNQYPKIATANGIVNPDIIHVGQKLLIP